MIIADLAADLADLAHPAGKRVNADIYQKLERQLVVPWVHRMYLGGRMSSDGFFRGSHFQGHPATLGVIFWNPVDLPPYSLDLK
jgi:hypothetical protein